MHARTAAFFGYNYGRDDRREAGFIILFPADQVTILQNYIPVLGNVVIVVDRLVSLAHSLTA